MYMSKGRHLTFSLIGKKGRGEIMLPMLALYLKYTIIQRGTAHGNAEHY